MKKIIITLALVVCSSVQAQINIGTPGADPVNKADEMKIKVASKNAEYNGAIVGFAQACNLNAADYNKVEALLFKNLNTVGLNHSEIDKMREIFDSTVASAKEKGKRHSPTECALFNEEFKKIIAAMNGNGVDPNKK